MSTIEKYFKVGTGLQFPDGTYVTTADGLVGATGAQGAQGNTGLTGSTGPQGNQGATGAQGNQGATGVTGATGLTGATGIQGTQGADGKGYGQLTSTSSVTPGTGSKSFTVNVDSSTTAYAVGAQVKVNSPGQSGSMNGGISSYSGTSMTINIGYSNMSGGPYSSWQINLSGQVGQTGATGAQGNQGATGAQGNQGATGVTGNDGATGAQGVQGIQGIQGEIGATGAQGVKGDKGDTGDAGATGATGPQGNPGADGDRYHTTSSSSLATGNSGSGSVTVDDLNVDYTPGQSILLANDGVVVQHATVTSYNSGTGLLSFTKTKYTGTSGTYSSWIINLDGAVGIQGEAGATGATGPKGDQGDIGATGAQGNVGATGSQGVAGATGAQGVQGIQGIQGEIGATGAQGAVGATGAQGAQGAVGATGAQGPQGDQGLTGDTGPQGDVGATGATGADGTFPSPMNSTANASFDIVLASGGLPYTSDYGIYANPQTGLIQAGGYVAGEGSGAQNGYAFSESAQDTGMYSSGDGHINFYNNAVQTVDSTSDGWNFQQRVQAPKIYIPEGSGGVTRDIIDADSVKVSTFYTSSISGSGVVGLSEIPAGSYTTVKYLIQAIDDTGSGTRIHSQEMSCVYANGNLYETEYGIIYSDSSLGDFNNVVSSGNIVLQYTPANDITNVQVIIYLTSIAA